VPSSTDFQKFAYKWFTNPDTLPKESVENKK
jgi:hypothetical protein